MYAIIKSGGKQYKVHPGDTLRVEKLEKDLGAEFELTDVLAIGGDKTFVGEPNLSNAKVTVVVTNQAKAPKVIVFKKKRRQGYRRMQGHRQPYTELYIKAITNPEGKTVEAQGKPNVFDPMKKLNRLEEQEAARLAAKKEGREAAMKLKQELKDKKAAAKKKATAKKKTAAKKAAKKKTAAKKSTAKKKTAAKKSTAKKKTAKKSAAKKTTKKKS